MYAPVCTGRCGADLRGSDGRIMRSPKLCPSISLPRMLEPIPHTAVRYREAVLSLFVFAFSACRAMLLLPTQLMPCHNTRETPKRGFQKRGTKTCVDL